MISPDNAAKIVLEKTGYKQLYCVKDYDRKYYVVGAAPDGEKIYRDVQTTFRVDKTSGEVSSFMLNGSTIDSYQKAKIVFK